MIIVATWLWTLSAPVQADAADSLTLWIDGHNYQVALSGNERLASALGPHQALIEGRHFRGRIAEDPDSWVRVSRMSGGWEGLAHLFGRVHVIGGDQSGHELAPMSFSFQNPPRCGLDHAHSEAELSPDAMMSPMMAQTVSASYDSLCENQVAGVCLLLELEVAFDLQFQQKFPDDFQDRAVSILNMVEGFYFEQFGIGFDTLSLTFLKSDVFTTSTSANALLDDVRTKVAEDSLPFRENRQALFHLISGRNFDGSTAGLAYVGTLCNTRGFGTGVTNAFSSNVLTAVVVAHELGHNLGSDHDGNNNSCSSGYVMSSWANENATRFSDCSATSFINTINSRSDLAQCFNFPADASLRALASNPESLPHADIFQAAYQIGYQQASETANWLDIRGTIAGAQSGFELVTIDGVPCDLEGNRYTCRDIVPGNGGQQLMVHGYSGTSSEVVINQEVFLVSLSGEVKDIRPENNRLESRFTVVPKSVSAPANLRVETLNQGFSLNWEVSATAGAAYLVERLAPAQSTFIGLSSRLPAGTTSYQDFEASDAGEYQYRVVALQDGLRSVPGNTVTVFWVEAPVAPTQVSVSEADGGVILAWQSLPGAQTDYAIERRRIDATVGSWKFLDSVPVPESEFHDITAIPGMVYDYRVVAINAVRMDASAGVRISLAGAGSSKDGDTLIGRLPQDPDVSNGDSVGSGGGSASFSWLLLMLSAGALKLLGRRGFA
ncbi:peptidase M12 [Marinobacter halophilus]|uniref:Peptidase M12 n=1 Tax=Marinobacter halophilus TaxID=1323740 RepID=A0A2T1KFN2_9GAMM|nr:peptidase M12 [Marinobacter halophilus]